MNIEEMFKEASSFDDVIQIYGGMISEAIFAQLEEGELSFDDSIVIQFLPCLYGLGNLEKLKVIAKVTYDDTRSEVICDFIDMLMEKVAEGQRQLKGGN